MPKHHYVMKAHLDKFVHPTSDNRRLYPYRRGVGLLPWKRDGFGPKGLGWATDFYSQVREGGSVSNDLDYSIQAQETLFFGSVKGRLSPLSRCIFDADFFPYTEAQKAAIAFCAAFSRLRSPVQIHDAAMVSEFAANAFALKVATTSDTVEWFEKRKGLSSEEARAAAHEWKTDLLEGNLRAGVGKDKERQDGLESLAYIKVLVASLTEMCWRLLVATGNDFFLTSDNPVVFEDRAQPTKRFNGIRQPRVEVWYPLSHRIGLLSNWTMKQQGRFGVGHSQVRALNRRMIKWCYRNVYSPLPEDWIEHAVRNDDFNPLLDRFTTLGAVVEPAKDNIIIEAPASAAAAALENGEPADVFAELKMH